MSVITKKFVHEASRNLKELLKDCSPTCVPKTKGADGGDCAKCWVGGPHGNMCQGSCANDDCIVSDKAKELRTLLQEGAKVKHSTRLDLKTPDELRRRSEQEKKIDDLLNMIEQEKKNPKRKTKIDKVLDMIAQ